MSLQDFFFFRWNGEAPRRPVSLFDTVFKKILEMGLEPMTLGLLDLRSNRLSYTSSCDDVIKKTLLYILQYIVYHRSRSNSLLHFVGL